MGCYAATGKSEQTVTTAESNEQPQVYRIYLLILVGLVLLISLYMLARFSGGRGELDTATLTRIIWANIQDARLIPESGAFANGYGYQVLAMFVIQTTGISLSSFQSILAILLMAWLVLPAWLAFRELVHSELAASLSVLILLAQPEFLFPLLRGTHEKFTRGLMFVCLYLLLRSLRARSLKQGIPLVACFYLSSYALIAFNTFMATSFTLAIVLSLAIMWLIGLWSPQTRERSQLVTRKLLYVIIGTLIIAFIFTFYAYPPATKQLLVLQDVWDRLSMLFLQVETTADNPYQVVLTGWVSMQIYYLVTLANWLLLFFTLPIWLKQTYEWIIKRTKAPEQYELALWAFYAAFAFLGFVSIFVDISGAIAGNLQHRSFSSFAMFAAPIAGAWMESVNRTSSHWGRIFRIGAGILVACLMVLAMFKATNEPLLSNYWSFTTPSEIVSIDWAEQALNGRSLWVGSTDRISSAYYIDHAIEPQHVRLNAYKLEPSTHDYLVSETIQLYALRTNQQLPIQVVNLITYDNGTAQIYHRRPVTPFQK